MSAMLVISGIIPADEKWNKMKGIYDSCVSMNISVPEEVLEFFDYGKPDDKGREIYLTDTEYEWHDENYSGYEIELSKIPKDIKYIRVYISY